LHDLTDRVAAGGPLAEGEMEIALMIAMPERLPRGMRTLTIQELSLADLHALVCKMRDRIDSWQQHKRSKLPPTATDYSEIERRILGGLAESAAKSSAMPTGASPTGRDVELRQEYFDEGKEMANGRPGPGPGWEYYAPNMEWRAIPPGTLGHEPSAWEEYGRQKYGYRDDVPKRRNREYLFVGGVGAGQRRAVPKEHSHFALSGDFEPSSPATPVWPEASYTSTYRRVEVTVGNATMEVMAETSMGPADVAMELLKHYRPNAVDDCGECRSRSAYERMKK